MDPRQPEQLELEWSRETPPAAPLDPGPPARVERAPSSAPAPAPSPRPDLRKEALRRQIEKNTGLRVDLTITNNTSRVMSFKKNSHAGAVKLRVHHMFLDAPAKVVSALGTWITQPKRKSSATVLNEYVRNNGHLMERSAPRRVRLRTKGRYFDLQKLYEEVNRDYFGGSVSAAITWGKFPAKRRRRSIRFGSYCHDRGLIRIHPALDQDFVPEFFVRYIVFHELLHAHLGVREVNGRRFSHTREFRRIEMAYPDYARAEEWQAQPGILKRLLRS